MPSALKQSKFTLLEIMFHKFIQNFYLSLSLSLTYIIFNFEETTGILVDIPLQIVAKSIFQKL